jgi:hypothetical protein
MVQFGIQLGASSHPVSGPAAERPDVRRRLHARRRLVYPGISGGDHRFLRVFEASHSWRKFAGDGFDSEVRPEIVGMLCFNLCIDIAPRAMAARGAGPYLGFSVGRLVSLWNPPGHTNEVAKRRNRLFDPSLVYYVLPPRHPDGS